MFWQFCSKLHFFSYDVMWRGLTTILNVSSFNNHVCVHHIGHLLKKSNTILNLFDLSLSDIFAVTFQLSEKSKWNLIDAIPVMWVHLKICVKERLKEMKVWCELWKFKWILQNYNLFTKSTRNLFFSTKRKISATFVRHFHPNCLSLPCLMWGDVSPILYFSIRSN